MDCPPKENGRQWRFDCNYKLPLHLWSFLLWTGVPLKLSYGMPVWVSVIYISCKDNMICYDEEVGWQTTKHTDSLSSLYHTWFVRLQRKGPRYKETLLQPTHFASPLALRYTKVPYLIQIVNKLITNDEMRDDNNNRRITT